MPRSERDSAFTDVRLEDESMFEEPASLNSAQALLDDEEPRPVTSLPWYVWVLCASIDMLGPFSTDSYIPNMPEMEDELGASRTLAGLTLQLNWIVKGFSNVWLGTLSDRFGRRRTLLASFLLYIGATATCAVTPNIWVFLAARIVQGIGEGNATITSAIARDVLEDEVERMRMMAVLGTIRPLAIIVAPSVGGLLGSFIGWRAVFWMLCGWGSLNVVLTGAVLPETTTAAQRAEAESSNFWGNLGKILKHRESMAFIVTFSVIFSGAMSMLSNVSWLLETHFGIGVVKASLLIGSVPVSMIVASLLVAMVGGKSTSPFVVLKWGVIGMAVAGVWCFGVAFLPFGELRAHWYVVQSCFYAMVTAQSVAMPPCMAMFMQPWKDEAGLASGCMALVRTSVSSVAAIGSTMATDAFHVRGLLTYIGCLLALSQVSFWGMLAPVLDAPPPNAPVLHDDTAAYKRLAAGAAEGTHVVDLQAALKQKTRLDDGSS